MTLDETPAVVAITTAPDEALPFRLCLNCRAEVAGSYCSACGQRASAARITFPRLLRSFADHVLSVDSNLLRTFRALMRRPGEFIAAFLRGRRVGYARPLPYYLLVVAVNVAASAVLPHPETSAGPDARSFFWEQNFVALQIGLAYGLLMLPLAAARRILHAGAGYSVAEHFVFLLYMLAQSLLVVLAAQVALWPWGIPLSGDAEGLTALTAFCGCVLWASRAFLGEPSWKVGLKLVAAFLTLLPCLGVAGLLLQYLRDP